MRRTIYFPHALSLCAVVTAGHRSVCQEVTKGLREELKAKRQGVLNEIARA